MFHPKGAAPANHPSTPPGGMLSKEMSASIRRSQSAGNVQLYSGGGAGGGDRVDMKRITVIAAAASVAASVAVAATATNNTNTNSSSSDTSSSCGSASGRLEVEPVLATPVDTTTQRIHTNSVKVTEDLESPSISIANGINEAVVFRRTVSESATLTAASLLRAGSSSSRLDMDNLQDRSTAIFPSLPDLVLRQLGLLVKNERETLTEVDIENRFISLAIGFKTDLLTLSSRLELQKRQRDQAEINMAVEVTRLKTALNHLSRVYIDSDSIELLDEIRAQVDIVQQATDRVSGSAELYGAVQQEHRLSRATEVLVTHVDNIKRSLDKMNAELEEVKRVLAENNIVMEDAPDLTDEPAPRTVRYRSLAAITAKKLNSKRRASIAALPRTLSSSTDATRTLGGLNQSSSPLGETRPRSHMANVVNSMRLKSSLSPILALASSTVDICEWPETIPQLMGDIDESSESQKEKVVSVETSATVDEEVNNNRVNEAVVAVMSEVETMKLPRLSITDTDNNTKHVMDAMHLEPPVPILNPFQHIRREMEQVMASTTAAVSTYVQRHRTAIVLKARFYLSSVLFAAAAWFLVWVFIPAADAESEAPLGR